MNELKRSGKRTREQLTFSDTYLVLDNLREYDFDLVSFYVTFNQYIDRRNYEGKAENSLIFANNEALFKAFNVSRNRFYRLLKLAYECGLIDIDKGNHNRNIYILNDTAPFEPLKKIRDWEGRNNNGKDKDLEEVEMTAEDTEEIEKAEDIVAEEINKEESEDKLKSKDLGVRNNKSNNGVYTAGSYHRKGQHKTGQVAVPKRDNPSSQNGITIYPELGQLNLPTDSMNSSVDSIPNNSNVFNRSKDINISKSISLSIDNYNGDDNFEINTINRLNNRIDRQDKSKKQLENFNTILEKCEVNLIDEVYRDAVIHAIKLLFLDIENKKIVKIRDNMVPANMIKEDMEKLNFLVIDHAIAKFKKASSEKEIRNTVVYLKTCIYNSIHEVSLDIDNELRHNGIIY
ncbi:hypothetical protein KQI88_10370 [Alkaliphilus sp. MSJ-5]|uniref:Uncharacterized protein n=1 Tax=Alkaliphilus flagellatus TaxID=2841507 RepID=A0ABS6G2W0_9FIRM|nr:hypothetical protein [Alkaliphilus flagellatus]MBU5676823.1 hypothetical protein [Alkaliphilus flagellatus]